MRETVMLRGGFVPSWMKEHDIKSKYINARVETAHSTPMFRTAFRIFAGLLNRDIGWFGGKSRTVTPTNDSKTIFELASFLLDQHWSGEPVGQIQVTALDPNDTGFQYDLFQRETPQAATLYQALDDINERFGEFTIAPAPLLHRSKSLTLLPPHGSLTVIDKL